MIKHPQGYKDIKTRTFIEFTDQLAAYTDQGKDILNLPEDGDEALMLIAILYDTNIDDVLEWSIEDWIIAKKALKHIMSEQLPHEVKTEIMHPTYGILKFNIVNDYSISVHQNMMLDKASKKYSNSMAFLPEYAAIMWQPEGKFKLKYVDELTEFFNEVPITDIYAGFFLFVVIGLEHMKISESYSMMEMMIQTDNITKKLLKRKKKLTPDQLLVEVSKQLEKEWKKNGVHTLSSIGKQKVIY